jgi:hypothetical protein
MDLKEFKCRCSKIGDIMVNGRGGGLGKTTESFVKQWMKEQLYGYQKFVSTKQMEKGHEVEFDAIKYYDNNLDKNEESFENDYLTGTPDIIDGDYIKDIKSSWDLWTFPLFEDELPTKDYYWQMQGYMALTGRKSAKVIYVLIETPIHLLNNWTDVDYQYADKERKLRVKEFIVERNDEDIQKIYDRVKEIRKYVKELHEKIN